MPDFYLYETDKWLALPYELNGLSEQDIAEHKPMLKEIVDQMGLVRN